MHVFRHLIAAAASFVWLMLFIKGVALILLALIGAAAVWFVVAFGIAFVQCRRQRLARERARIEYAGRARSQHCSSSCPSTAHVHYV